MILWQVCKPAFQHPKSLKDIRLVWNMVIRPLPTVCSSPNHWQQPHTCPMRILDHLDSNRTACSSRGAHLHPTHHSHSSLQRISSQRGMHQCVMTLVLLSQVGKLSYSLDIDRCFPAKHCAVANTLASGSSSISRLLTVYLLLEAATRQVAVVHLHVQYRCQRNMAHVSAGCIGTLTMSSSMLPGRGGPQYHSWQASASRPPPLQGAPFARPPGPQPPAGPPPGIRPAGRGTSGHGQPGRGRHGQGHGPARGRGRGRTSGYIPPQPQSMRTSCHTCKVSGFSAVIPRCASVQHCNTGVYLVICRHPAIRPAGAALLPWHEISDRSRLSASPLVLAGLIAVLPCACRGAGCNDNIEAYVSPAMLQDPWAVLMKQHQPAAAAEQPKPPVEEGTSTTPAVAGQSMSDVFDAVEQVKYHLSRHCDSTILVY